MGVKQFTANYLMKAGDNDLDTIAIAYAKIIQEEIDNEIVIDMLKMNGWIVVNLERFKDMKHPIDVQDWCTDNIGDGKWKNLGPTFLFRESKHAEWFSLRWT
jgi:hypothetical protein